MNLSLDHQKQYQKKLKAVKVILTILMIIDDNDNQDIELHGTRGDPICVKTRSNHCNGPFRCNSIQQGVLVTVWRRYSAPQPLTKLIRIVHILVN